MNNFEYFIVLFLSGIIPISISIFHPFSPFKGKYWIVLLAVFLSAIPFIIWDVFATFRGHWEFNYNYTVGFKIINLPIEEYLFFIIIPINSIFIWTLLRKFHTLPNIFKNFIKPISKND